MIKLCLVIIGVGMGGAQTYVYHLLKYLDRSKFSITLVCNKKDEHSKLFQFQDVRVICLPLSGTYNFQGLFHLFRVFKKERFDIVHSHGAKADIIGLIAAFLAKVPFRVSTIHEDVVKNLRLRKYQIWKRILFFLLLRVAYLAATRLITVSKANKKSIHSLTKGRHVEIIYSGIEQKNELEDKIKLPSYFKKQPIIIYSGRISPEKGLHILIKAVHLLKKDSYDVFGVILGHASDIQYLKQIQLMIKKYRIENQFYFGGVAEDIYPWLLKAQIAVIPSFSESMSFSILEAWNCKLPVVASRVGGIPELISDGQNGLLFEPGDFSDLAKKVIYLLKNLDIRKQLGIKGYETLIKSFSANNFIYQIEKLYLSLAKDLSKSSNAIGF